MRVQVTTDGIAEVAGDAVVQIFRPPIHEAVPAWPHISTRGRSLVLSERGAMTWLEGRRLKAPRLALLASADEQSRTPRGWNGNLARHERMAMETQGLRGVGGMAERGCFDHDVQHVIFAPTEPAEAILPVLEGFLLRAHGTVEFQKDECSTTVETVTVCVTGNKDLEARIEEVRILCEATNNARSLADLPGNVGTPEGIATRVRERLPDLGVGVEVLETAELERLRMRLLLGVARGGGAEPRLLILRHKPASKTRLPTVVLLGKGLTHDTGGYNLKTTNQLHELTYDKAGGMAVVGALEAVARLNAPAEVIGMVPLVENCIDGNAYKPGDILRAMNGTTVFIDNTDAEGRLVLADCLTYARRFRPNVVVDLATLTGACSVALGEPFSGLFSTHDGIRDHLIAAGHETGELLWPMPIHPIHRGSLRHHKAEMRNSGVRGGSACSAAAFLRAFARYPWAHIDMAGKANWNTERDYLGRGATGWGVRLLTRFVRDVVDAGWLRAAVESAEKKAKQT